MYDDDSSSLSLFSFLSHIITERDRERETEQRVVSHGVRSSAKLVDFLERFLICVSLSKHRETERERDRVEIFKKNEKFHTKHLNHTFDMCDPY